jgi:hypothetical protein
VGPAPLWKNQTKLPDGHRIFQATHHCYIGALPASATDDPRGIWALADDSGVFPHDTDDGVLWLDFNRDLGAGASTTTEHDGVSPTIPLLNKTGKTFSTITDTCTLLTLSIRFGWHISVLGTPVQVVEV